MKKKLSFNKEQMEALNEHANNVAMEKVLTLLVLYQEKGRNEYETFESFIETVLKGAYGESEYDGIKARIKKKMKKKEEKG